MLGSYTDFGTGSAQYNWLQGDLGKVDRGKTPWIVVIVHAPWYNSNTAHQGEAESDDMKKAMEALLYGARVDVVFAGHVHAYERFVSACFSFPCFLTYVNVYPRTTLLMFVFKMLGYLNLYQTRVYNEKADRCGPVHITIGDGGNREGLASK